MTGRKLSNFWVCDGGSIGLYKDGGAPWRRTSMIEVLTKCDELNRQLFTLLGRTDAPWIARRAYVNELFSVVK